MTLPTTRVIPQLFPGNHPVKDLFFYVPPEHLPDVLEHGILSNRRAEAEGLVHVDLADKKLRALENTKVVAGRALGDFVACLLRPCCPMTKRLVERGSMAILCLSPDILARPGTLLASTRLSVKEDVEYLPVQQYTLSEKAFTDLTARNAFVSNGGSEAFMVKKNNQQREILIPDGIHPSAIRRIIVRDQKAKDIANQILGSQSPVPIDICTNFFSNCIVRPEGLLEGDFCSHLTPPKNENYPKVLNQVLNPRNIKDRFKGTVPLSHIPDSALATLDLEPFTYPIPTQIVSTSQREEGVLQLPTPPISVGEASDEEADKENVNGQNLRQGLITPPTSDKSGSETHSNPSSPTWTSTSPDPSFSIEGWGPRGEDGFSEMDPSQSELIDEVSANSSSPYKRARLDVASPEWTWF